VTHDQSEALSMADRVAVFNDGRLVQVGTPREVYERPRTRFVADFVGSSNVFDPAFSAQFCGIDGWTSVRPESIRIGPRGLYMPDGRRLDGTAPEGVLTAVQYHGAVSRVTVDIAGTPVGVSVPAGELSARKGERVTLHFGPDAVQLLAPE
jgi:putative spermidine/putrescine transport system ATP-binding protein